MSERQQPQRRSRAPQTPVNGQIRARRVRLIDENDEQVGIVSREEALRRATAKDLDLVCVAPTADPPVCRLMQWSKYRLRQQQKERDQRKAARTRSAKEVKFRPAIADHDYEVKLKHVRRFVEEGHRVQVVVQMRGRQNAHPELAVRLMERVGEDVTDIANATTPNRAGNTVTISITPRA